MSRGGEGMKPVVGSVVRWTETNTRRGKVVYIEHEGVVVATDAENGRIVVHDPDEKYPVHIQPSFVMVVDKG